MGGTERHAGERKTSKKQGAKVLLESESRLGKRRLRRNSYGCRSTSDRKNILW